MRFAFCKSPVGLDKHATVLAPALRFGVRIPCLRSKCEQSDLQGPGQRRSVAPIRRGDLQQSRAAQASDFL
jgi:hypothetical protein